MKRADRAAVKDTAIPTLAHAASRKGDAKGDAETVFRKNQVKGLKGPSKNAQQNDLREQCRVLIATNEDLQRQISEMKEHVAVLEQRCSDFQEENTEIRKQLRDCHALLIAERLDPVSGGKIEGTAQQTEEQRKELMTVSQNLLMELKLFDETAREHGTHLAEVQNTMTSLKEAREELHLNRESFSVDAEEMERALEEAERLLVE